jgi:hypothetical protein
MIAAHLEKIFFHYVLDRRELIDVVKPRFFETADIRKAYEIVQEFIIKYNDSPTKAQINELIKLKGQSDNLDSVKIEYLYDVNLKEYEDTWLKESAESWIEYKNLDLSVYDLLNYLKTTKVTAENVKDVVHTAKNIIADRNNIQFDFDEGLDFFNPESHIQPASDTFSSGYDYVDMVLGGGWYSKALFCFIGEMKIGKCLTSDTQITVRNKKSGLVEKIQIGDFHKRFVDRKKIVTKVA